MGDTAARVREGGFVTGTAEAAGAAAGPAQPAAARPWWTDVIASAGAVSVLIVVALWVRGRGVQDLGAWPAGLTSLGRLTGLVAADLLLIQVLLMARVPWIERTYGQDMLARWHRVVGFVRR